MLEHREIKTDFCVVGGGMAGICAAIAAARKGLKVVLMHERPVLGGNASSEIRMWVCGAGGRNNRETGIIEEIMLENCYRNPTKNYYIWDSILYDFVRREKNITLLLNCTCLRAWTMQGEFADGRDLQIKCIQGYQMTTQSFIEVMADFYADCSGDSILAPLTGAKFRIGRESAAEFGEQTYVTTADEKTMGMSCLIQGRETNIPVRYIAPERSTHLTRDDFENRNPNIYNPFENFWYLELGGDKKPIADTENVAESLIELATGTWDYIKNSGDYDADNWDLEFMGFLPGKRESRRMMGEYIINSNDIISNTLYEDTVAFGGWPLDDHYPEGFYHKGEPNTNIKTPAPYCIPYRALYSINVDNLFFAGRNISTTHMALSSTRVMSTCALMGQAIGTAAALAMRFGLTPNRLYKNKMRELQSELLYDDCFLPIKKRYVSETCLKTELINGDDRIRNGEDRPHIIYNTDSCGISVKNDTEITYDFKSESRVKTVHVVFDSDLNRETLDGCESEKYHAMRCNVLLSSPQLHMPYTLCRDFTVNIVYSDETCDTIQVNDNLKRTYDIMVRKHVIKISLIPHSNWGGTGETNIFSFDFR